MIDVSLRKPEEGFDTDLSAEEFVLYNMLETSGKVALRMYNNLVELEEYLKGKNHDREIMKARLE